MVYWLMFDLKGTKLSTLKVFLYADHFEQKTFKTQKFMKNHCPPPLNT